MRRLTRRLRKVGVGLVLWAGLTATSGWAAPDLSVRAVAVERTDAGTRLVLDLSRDAAVRPEFLGAPNPRFVLDLPRAAWNARAVKAEGLVQAVRHGQHARSTRLVLDLAAEARLIGSDRIRTAAGVRLTYDLAPRDAARASQPAMQAELTMMPRPVVQSPAVRGTAKVVVIDPGHGGKDPGALGKAQGREKDFNLAAALVLREQLQKRGYKVFLTRETDTYLPLAERVKVARDRQANLFISLHSDADPKGVAKGATVYTLSQRGVQRTRSVMDAQDWHVDVGEAGGAAKSILLDLTQRETKDHSARFAEALIARVQDAAPLARRAPANAGFFVLLAPDVPAVLFEMGYVTHADDERRLANASARRSLMGAVADSVDDYFETPKTYASVSR